MDNSRQRFFAAGLYGQDLDYLERDFMQYIFKIIFIGMVATFAVDVSSCISAV